MFLGGQLVVQLSGGQPRIHLVSLQSAEHTFGNLGETEERRASRPARKGATVLTMGMNRPTVQDD